jgi:hypothetical protein
MKMMQAVRKAPKAIPGTKPAAKDFPEKESDDEMTSEVLAASVGVEVAAALLVDVGAISALLEVGDEGLLDAASAAVCATHTLAPLQV